MRYTGLNDSNGKPIMKGDIFIDGAETELIVEFENGSFVLNTKGEKEQRATLVKKYTDLANNSLDPKQKYFNEFMAFRIKNSLKYLGANTEFIKNRRKSV